MSIQHSIDLHTLRRFAKILTADEGGKKCCPLNRFLVAGNTKVPNTTAIFNLGAATDCPSFKLGLCTAYHKGKHICYALKSEREHRPEVLPHRRKSQKIWAEITPTEFVSQFVIINALKVIPFTALRFNESGDFWGQSCVDKANQIACMLKHYGITTYAYTCRRDLDFSRAKHIVISGSSFMKDGVTNEFRIIPNVKAKPKGYGLCKGNCKVCTRCLKRGMKTAVVAH